MSQDKSVPKQERQKEYLQRMLIDPIAVMIKYCDRIDNLITVSHFSQGGFKWYLKNTDVLIETLGTTILQHNAGLHLWLDNVLADSRKLYEVLYGNK